MILSLGALLIILLILSLAEVIHSGGHGGEANISNWSEALLWHFATEPKNESWCVSVISIFPVHTFLCAEAGILTKRIPQSGGSCLSSVEMEAWASIFTGRKAGFKLCNNVNRSCLNCHILLTWHHVLIKVLLIPYLIPRQIQGCVCLYIDGSSYEDSLTLVIMTSCSSGFLL